MKKIIIFLLIELVLININLISSTETFTPIFCNDYEFTCCGGKVESINSYPITDEVSWTCPTYAYKCELLSQLSKSWYIGFGNCHPDSGTFCDGWICDQQSLGATIMNSLDQIYLKDQCSNPSVQAQIKIIRPQLGFCGKSGAVGEEVTCGVAVDGADGCKFNPENGIIYTSTSSLSGKQQISSYVVPVGNCILAFQSGDRHICGYKEESCSSNSDCSGHTYGNQECNGKTLQTYGCKDYGNPVSEKDRAPSDNGWGENKPQPSQSGSADFGKRCEVVNAEQVQCCGDTDCGSNMFCDTSTFTCKENVQCKKDYDCGVSVQCDPYTNTLKKPICKSGTCEFEEKKVECCLNDNCIGGYCDEYRCKEGISSKLNVSQSLAGGNQGITGNVTSSSSSTGSIIIKIFIILIGISSIGYYFYTKNKDKLKTKAHQVLETAGKHCKRCGELLNPKNKYCIRCGQKTSRL